MKKDYSYKSLSPYCKHVVDFGKELDKLPFGTERRKLYVTKDEYRELQEFYDELENITLSCEHYSVVNGVTDLSYERYAEERRQRYLDEDMKMYFINRIIICVLVVLSVALIFNFV